MKKLIILIAFVVLGSCNYAYGQCPVMPQGFLCITQAEGNKAAQIARESAAKDAKIVVLEEAQIEKDKITETVKATAAKNETDLKASLSETQTKLGVATGQLIESKANEVRSLAVIDLLLKNSRMKCSPFSICIGR